MAIPTLYTNTPGVGQIAWDAFTIRYGGASYAVPAGNTASKFVWWLFNAGSPILDGGNVLPNLGADDLLLFLNKNGTPVNALKTQVVEGSLIVEESILANALSANSVTGEKILAGSIDTGHIKAGAVTATRIAAGTITGNEIAANAIAAGHLVANAVTAGKIDANAVTTNTIAANAILGDKIAANQIGAGHLAADAITANHLTAANALIDALKVSDLSATNLNGANITGGTIAVGTSSSGVDNEEFSGTAFPSGWEHNKFYVGLANVPGASVKNAGVPAGTVGSAVEVDFGPANNTKNLNDRTSGYIYSDTMAQIDQDVVMRFRHTANPSSRASGVPAERFELFVRNTGTWQQTPTAESGIFLELGQDVPTIATRVNGTRNQLASLPVTLVKDTWYKARLKVVAGSVKATVWVDGAAEPQPTVATSNVSLGAGRTGLFYQTFTFGANNSVGLKTYVDHFNVDKLNSGFVVNPDGTAKVTALEVNGVLKTSEDTTRPRIELGQDTGGIVDAHEVRLWPGLSTPENAPGKLVVDNGSNGLTPSVALYSFKRTSSDKRAAINFGADGATADRQKITHEANRHVFYGPDGYGALDAQVEIDGTLKVNGEVTAATGTTPYSSRYRTQNQAINNTTETKVSFGVNDVAQGNISWDNTNNVWTIAKPGVYTLTYNLAWSTNSTGRREGYIYKNATRVCKTVINGAQTTDLTLTGTWIGPLAAGDTIGLRVYQNSGSQLTLTSGLDTCNAQISYVGP